MYSNLTERTKPEDCLPCPGGQYCDQTGMTVPAGDCSAGHYCSGNSTTAMPTAGVGGDQCQSGSYCPAGSYQPTLCPPGSYCAGPGLSNTSGLCLDGYYCIGGASVPNPTDGNVTGDICPQGAYCVEGSPAPSLCPPGTYVNSTGHSDLSHCLSCMAGYYCDGSGNVLPDGPCSTGYHCPGGQDAPSSVGLNCSQGHYCPEGSAYPVRCASGSYQDQFGMGQCKGCPAGYFCDNTLDPVVLFNSSACPLGYYCPDNTTRADEFPCPPGTYNNQTHRSAEADCAPCPGGQYCDSWGLDLPAGLCDAGYYCTLGANGSAPSQDPVADVCPVGFYCPQGTVTPQSCPLGTYNSATGRQNVSECTACSGGRFCPYYNMTSPGPLCQPGYYCPSAAEVSNHLLCTAGSYCLEGSDLPTPCPSGTFSNSTGLEEEAQCTNCTGGFYCPGSGQTEATDLCWGGYYCPIGMSDPNPSLYLCPQGLHCPNGSEIYKECPDGHYTSTSGLASCDLCPQGFYCLPVNPSNASLNAQSCPEGYYCPQGTGSDWQACPSGTYSSTAGLYDVSQCLPCDAGKYCMGEHLTAYTADCAAGFYCTSGVDRPMPGASNDTAGINCSCPGQAFHTGVGGVCPMGHHCPLGSDLPTPCPAGSYGDQEELTVCLTCPEGYYCLAGASAFTNASCPVGHYCPNGTQHSTEWRCPEGTYSPSEGGTSLQDCLDCPAGDYCAGPANWAPTGNCSAGWYCSGGAVAPNDTLHGGKCQPGDYCPEGSSAPQPCPGGQFCQTEGLEQPTGNCSAGYFCILRASMSTPTDGSTGDLCPTGFYCPEGSASPVPCNPGTYSPSTHNTQASDCLACTGGEFCGGYNLTASSGNCTAGYYCPQGEANPAAYQCPMGHYCPEGTSGPVLCPSGWHQEQVQQASCVLCPTGYYCDNSLGVVVVNDSVSCPQGHYCPAGTLRADQYPCPLGTFNNLTGLNQSDHCTPCSGGYYCDQVGLVSPTGLCHRGYYCKRFAVYATPNQTADADVCPQGYYCEEGTVDPTACPAGSFGATTGLRNVTECTPCTPGSYCQTPGLLAEEGPCDAGYFCVEGSSSATSELCPTGHYCPQGTGVPDRCPEGSFNPYQGLNASALCTPCTAGQYCDSEGLNATSGPCEPGFYCPGGQNSSRPAGLECPLSHYCPLNSSQPLPCANGTYMNHTMADQCYTCPDGWYCLGGDLVADCPEGYYCPAGTGVDWQACPTGTFSNQTGLWQDAQCVACTGGQYCGQLALTAPTGPCDSGYYCEYGLDRARPSGGNATSVNGSCEMPGGETGVGGVCPVGYYCPQGTSHPIPCGAGSFSNVSGLDACVTCPAGYYCLQGADTYLSTPCPEGHYCPAGTSSSTQFPCPAQTFYNLTMARDVADCLPCPGGWYCATDGLTTPTDMCDAGWYCSGNSSSPTPSSPEGGECQPGFYCLQGSYAPKSCDPGSYCETPGLSVPTGLCSPGYYCTLESNSSTPTDGTTGDVCPVGHYCSQGSGAQAPCEMDTYLDATGQDSVADCKACTPGTYCAGSGLAWPSGNCSAGYYCPGGQNTSSPVEYRCPVGHYCPEGVDAEIRCENGTYQDQETQASCKACPAGYFCDNTMGIVVLDNSTTLCPAGSFCPIATRYASEFLCPIGTFNNITGLQAEADCTPCLGGFYCPTPGIVTPVNLCLLGYFCKQSANISTPDQGSDANICPVGHYCPLGTADPVHCPKGTFGNVTGLQAELECTFCPAGSYCDQLGLTEVSGPCEAGFYCELASNTSQRLVCPVGHYCPEGSGVPSPCSAGTYTNTQGLVAQNNCTDCDPGQYCNDTGLASPVADCDAGFYCPGGDSAPNPPSTPCPIGLHCPLGSGAPVPCDPGTFTNLTQAQDCLECIAGFYCVPEEVVAGNSRAGHSLCPEGFYCPAGTGRNWTACPAGTFSDVQGLTVSSECQQCSGGQYCDRSNLTAPSGPCDAGFFCTLGSDTATPSGNHTGVAGICPLGHRCPEGTVLPLGCDAGTFQDQENQGECTECPAGYYCTANGTLYSDKLCPSGYYCPNATQYDLHYPCPVGSFNNLTGQASSAACTQCTPGAFCASPGLSMPTDLCDAGWYCTMGATSSTPSSPEGGKCLAGTYCPMGSSEPQGCALGQYCDVDAMWAPQGDCMAGYYCDSNSTTDRPTGTGGDRCPPGHYCQAGTWSPQPCPPGYFQPSYSAQNLSWCQLCTAGMYCNNSGLQVPDGDCEEGYYCPEGQTVRNPSSYECPGGHYCPTGSSMATLCDSGSYQDLVRQASCKECPAGFYCDNSVGAITSYAAYVCPEGHYCVNGTRVSTEFPCPAGSFNNITGLAAASDCFPCLGGYYCPGGTVYPSLPCGPGYYCRSGAQTAAPSQGTDADQCPVGHYCTEMTIEPNQCPPGTFSNIIGLMNVTECTPCTPGSYCDTYALTAPTALCTAGYYCVEGSSVPAPDICPGGRYCPQGTHTPVRCPSGSYSNATGLTAESQCTSCTAGYYCQNTGLTSEQGPCQAGYYCPQGSSVMTAVTCPSGLHCPDGSDVPLSCASGYYTNRTGMSACDICPDGYYCLPVAFGDTQPGYFNCPAGFYCPNGTGLDWMPCPAGTYSNQLILYKLTQCTDCDGGNYCGEENATAPTGPCDAGYYCQSGVDRPNPDNDATNSSYPSSCPLLGGHTGTGDICPRGYKCPVGSDLPEGCPAGTYQDQEGQDQCISCPAGYYCLANATEYLSSPCPSGHYCPQGTTHGDEFKCSVGTFNPAGAQTNDTACLSCTAGMYCQTQGLSAPTANCSAGWYCLGGAVQAMPTDALQGGRCQVGAYCPVGSENYTECDGGKYCQRQGLDQPTGDCSPGYYCAGSAMLSQPFDGVTGNECPTGHYCPGGTSYAHACPMGHYLDVLRSSVLLACKICTPGMYCDQEGLANPAGDCSPGYYCPAGQTSATPGNYSCPQGSYCVGGLQTDQQCASGTYQDLPGKASCQACPAGYYCNATFGGVINFGGYICPEGYYCPNSTEFAEQYPCPVGTFNNRTGLTNSLDCTDCVGGMACDQSGLTYPLRPCSAGYFCRSAAMTTTPTQGSNADECPAGSYCPEGTSDPVPCPQGTYSPSYGLTREADCLNCTAGYYCNNTGLTAATGECQGGYYCPESSVQDTQVVCPDGAYCPTGSPVPTDCPNGTYSNQTGLAASAQCTQCLEGYYCNGFGLTSVSGPCREGYYCPTGSSVESEVICPAAKHCPTGSAQPQDCPAGFYVDFDGAADCIVCPEGFYCVPELTVAGDASSSKWPCPEGFFCPNGTGHDWQACPAGTFSNATGLGQEDQCTPCLPGVYCQGNNLTSPSGPCDEGYYCVSGVDKSNPLMFNDTQCPTATTHPIIGHICPAGHYCPEGTDFPIGCPAGSFQDLTNQWQCKSCPEGYFCPANTSDYSVNACPAGYYCPVNTTDQYENPCPPGTFNNLPQQKALGACVACTPGMYCQGHGNAAPTANCSAGWYCTNASSEYQPSSNGGECQPGYYCPEGSPAMEECTPGQYCQTSGLASPTGPCDAGYYCPLVSTSPRQVDCPVGHYCVQGSDLPEACRNGTYGPVTNLLAEAECVDCDGGSYCNGTALSSVSGPCEAGYYCPAGQTVPNPYTYLCPEGHYCLASTTTPTRCDPGFYQNELGKDTCKVCPEGYYCDNTLAPVGDLSGFACQAGYYCPLQTERFNQYPCPSGTFNNATHRTNESECQPCLPGFYCQSLGLSQPEGPCYPGYYCVGGDSTPNPNATICPIGSYCPEGSYLPTPCPEGTMAASEGNSNETDCELCKPGTYCLPESSKNGTALTCAAGYICLTGSNLPNPTDGVIGYICPAGHYCLAGAVVESVCDKGTYAPTTGLGACLACPSGTSCPSQGMNDTEPCPAGYYCLNGTTGNGVPCPIGTYNPHTGLSQDWECLACPPGKFCNQTALDAPSGDCLAGFLCVENATHPGPNDAVNMPCPAGHYCLDGAVTAEPCPVGTMRNQTGGQSSLDCWPCDAGHYCNLEASLGPAGECQERYYCPDVASINSSMPSAFLCPPGFYCPARTGDPLACPPGFYQDASGSTDCIECPEGSYCTSNTSVPMDCPPYSYCPNGTADPMLCDNGTYTDAVTTGLVKADDCPQCITGKYCTGGRIADDCAAGYFCVASMDIPNPNNTYAPNGQLCPYGYYCPAGTTIPQTCPNLKFIDKEGAGDVSECQDCPAGRICPQNSTISIPCWPGYYCAVGQDKLPCPVTTYNDQEGGKDHSACLPCPPGYLCDQTGIANYTLHPCPVGSYCVNATSASIVCPAGRYRDIIAAGDIDDCFLCPAGYYCPDSNMTYPGIQCDAGMACPPGSWNQTICAAGYYCNMSMGQVPCPPGFYCPEASSFPIRCPQGHYCGSHDDCNSTDAGAIEPLKCPLGYKEFDGSPRATFYDTCEPCLPGSYGADPNRAMCQPCRAGVVCLGASTTDNPVTNGSSLASALGPNATNSYLCPPGYYCPENSSAPTPCPMGRYNSYEEAGSLDECTQCSVDHYNPYEAQSGCFICGAEAEQPSRGQSECLCVGAGRDFQVSDKSCPCLPGYLEVDGQKDCSKTVYQLCDEGSYTYQDGRCLSDTQFQALCSQEVCAVSEYVGYDRLLGLCLCKVDDLEEVCDLKCRKLSQYRLTFVCAGSPLEPYLHIRDTSNNTLDQIPASSALSIINARNVLTEDQCDSLDNSEVTINLVEMSEAGFLGVYSADPSQVQLLIETNTKGNYSGNHTSGFTVSRRRLLATSSVNGSIFSGISNPTVCLNYGEIMFFSVSNTYYPIYDRNNLYNTNSQFDYGGFRALIEAQSQVVTSTTLFAYKFTDPGVYTFYLSTDINQKMYVRVMAQNAQCSTTGPFYPTTAGAIIATGISVNQDILREPDWLIIFILLASAFLAVIIVILLLLLFRRYGWSKTSYLYPLYRLVTKHYNFDDYASKGSVVYPVRKFHRNLRMVTVGATVDGLGNGQPAVLDGAAASVKKDEFWDYDRQVDLEGFSSRQLYDTLSKQSRSVTQTIGQHKDDVKQMYQRIANQTDSLKGLWAAKMNLNGKSALATDADLALYDRTLSDLERELERRMTLGQQFEAVLDRQEGIMDSDETGRENHQVKYQTSLREAGRLLREHTTQLQTGDLTDSDGEFHRSWHNAVDHRVSLLIEKMSGEITDECRRVGAWGILGQGTGGQLLAGGSRSPVTRDDLFDGSGNARSSAVTVDEKTGLLRPKPGTQMLLADGTVTAIPPEHFVHPQTGHVLPILGNVAFDPITSRLVFVIDSATGEAARSEEPFIPFVPFPANPHTGVPVHTKLKALQSKSDLRYGAPMSDPRCGLHVPILAMTLHPQTGTVLPIGGIHMDPVTGLPVPIELGSLMADPISGRAVPILAVTLDEETGVVIPVGGTKEGDLPIIPGDSFQDGPSGKAVRVHGGLVTMSGVRPSAGGYQSLLDATVLACETRAVDVLREYKEAVHALGADGNTSGVRHEESAMEAAVKDLGKARSRMKAHLLRTRQDIHRRKRRAAILATTGGSPGMYEFSKTSQLLPILVGTSMDDPAGSGQQVPILGADRDTRTGKVVPLGGTMEDPEGEGLVPIMIGQKAVDPVSGEMSPVIGARLNPESRLVVPVTQASSAHRKPRAPPGAVGVMEEEIVARRGYWRRQRQREMELSTKEQALALTLMYNLDTVTVRGVQQSLEEIDAQTSQLMDSAKREVQRRGAAQQEYAAILPPDIVTILTAGDKTEHEREESQAAAHAKFSEVIRKGFGKLEQEEKRYQDRLDDLEGAFNPEAETTATQRYKQARARLQGELREQLRTRVENTDEQHSSLEYAREFSELCAVEAKVVLTRAALLAGDYDAQLLGVYGDSDSSGNQDSEMIPLLRQLIAMLESGGPFYLSSELLNLLRQGGSTEGGSSRVMNINVHGGTGQQMSGQQQKDQRKKASSKLVKSSEGDGMQSSSSSSSATDNAGVIVIGDMSRAKTSETMTEQEMSDKKKYLFEKQAYEAAKLENDLHSQEVQSLEDTINDFEKKKKESEDEVARDFAAKLAQAKTDQEKERLMLDYANSMTKLNNGLEAQKHKQMSDLREKLLERRRQGKKNLHQQHIAEAQREGVGADEVPDISLQSRDEMVHDLTVKQQNLEQHLAEIKSASIHPVEHVFDDVDDDDSGFYNLMESLGLRRETTADLLKRATERNIWLKTSSDEIIRKLKERKGRKVSPELSAEEMKNMSQDEIQQMAEARETQNEADRTSEESLLLKAWKEHEKQQLRQEQEAALREVLKSATGEERDRILAEFHDQSRRLDGQREDEKLRQQDKLRAKLAARKRMDETLDRDKAVNKELDHITKQHAAKGDNESAEVISSISSQLNGEALSAEQQGLVDQQLERQEALEREHGQQRRQAERQLDEELAQQHRAVDDQINQQKRLVLDNHRAQLDRELLLKGDKLTEEEHKRLMAKFKQEQEAIERNLESERHRQSNTLADKIMERRQKRVAQLSEKQTVAVEEEAIRQQQERDKLNEKLAKQVESTTLKDSVKGKDGRQAENLIYTVLRQRHMKEAIHLEDQLARAREAALRQRLVDIDDQRQNERQTLLSAFQQELLDLVGNAGSMSQDELIRRKEDLKGQQQKQLNDFDDLTTQLKNQAEKEVLPQQEIQDTNSRLELKEKQLQEIADAMRSYSPVDELKKKYEQEAREAREEAEKYRRDVMKKMQEELERRKLEQKHREEERMKRMHAQMLQLEKDLEEEHRREVERQKERAAEKERLKKQQLEERDRREREEIAAANLSKDEKERLLKEHDKNIAKLKSAMHQEQARSQDSLAAKLEARRQRRLQTETARLEKTDQLHNDEELRGHLRRRQQERSLQSPQDGATPGGSHRAAAGEGGAAGAQLIGFSPTGSQEQDWVNLLMASPLFKQISDLENMINSTSGAAQADGASATGDAVKGADYSKAYIDVKDAQWVCKGDLLPTDVNSLGPSQFVIYRFGVFLIRFLHHSIGTPEVSLLLASNLPPNNYHNNAFRNSVFYQHARQVLFVRRERMESVGEFVMVVLHSLAHIHTGDMTDDANVLFLRVFYKAMKEVCQDMFFSRSRSSPAAQSMLGNATPRPTLERAMVGAATPDDKVNAVGELVSMRVDTPTQMDFSDQRLSQRLSGYHLVASNARLRQQLAASGGYLSSGDFISARMAELKGTPAQAPRSPGRRGRGPVVQSPRDLLDTQIVSLRTKSDQLNAELLQTLKMESEVREGLQKAESSSGDADQLQQQLTNTLIRKEDLVKQSILLDDDISAKEKSLKAKRK